MKIAQLTPGTGHFYCGSCLRDHALSQALRERGHDVFLVPLYLPLVLEQPAAATQASVQMGGINLFLQHCSGLFRHLPRSWTRFLDAPGLLRWSSRRGNMTDASRLGAITLSTLRGDDGPIAREVNQLASWLADQERPDVVILSNVMLAGVARRLHQTLGCPVVCTLQGEAPFLDALPEPHRDQAWQVLRERCADLAAVLPVSHSYAELMTARLGLPADRVHVVHNGIDLADLKPADPPARPTIGYLARMCRDKGLPTLIAAFEALHAAGEVPDARLRVAGVQLAEDRPLVAELTRRLERRGLADRVEFLPNLERDAKVAFLQSLSVLSVPATYGESFGLYLLEAMACGVPVVQPRHGAFPEILEATGGGVLCAPDDPEDLARALARLLKDPAEQRRLGTRGCQQVREKFTAAHMASRLEAVLQQVVPSASLTTPHPAS